MAFNWYTTLPGDSDIVSQHPANERAFRTTVNSAFALEHDTAEARHKFGVGNTAARDAITTWVDGSIWFNTSDTRNLINIRSGGTWLQAAAEFGTGVSVIFSMSAAPVGWVQEANNDRVLRVVSGAGAGEGGSWAISGLSTESSNHTHNVVGATGSESQTHFHNVSGTTSVPSGAFGFTDEGAPDAAVDDHTHTININSGTESALHTHNIAFASGVASATHTHTGNGAWRPAYLDVIRATKS